VAHARIGAGEGRFGDALLGGLPDKFAGDRGVPFFWPVVAVEFQVEGEEAAEVTPFGVDGGWRLPGDLGHEVGAGQRAEAAFACGEQSLNIMLLIIVGNEFVFGHSFRHRTTPPAAYSVT
jgi:hypothetical protein